MTWEPITLTDLVVEIGRGVQQMSAEELALWRRIRLEPSKWACEPWGDEGGGFWVVATVGQYVVRFNDIEDGFNVSPFTNHGVIDDYWCNQDELHWVVHRLVERGHATR